MKRSHFTSEQIVFALRQAESGTLVVEVCRKMGIVEQTFYRWKEKYVGMGVADVRKAQGPRGGEPQAETTGGRPHPGKQMLQDVLQNKAYSLLNCENVITTIEREVVLAKD